MALWLRDIKLSLDQQEEQLSGLVARELCIARDELEAFKIIRRSLDARNKRRIHRVYTVEFSVADEAGLLTLHAENRRLETAPQSEEVALPRLTQPHHAVVVGMGPAGLFAAKRLAELGAKVSLIERGRPLEQRVRDVETFWQSGDLNPQSHVQFGEGGAGTFSDGKLTTRLRHPLRQTVLQTLVEFGAPKEILLEANPHIGTDRLRQVLLAFRQHLLALGVEISFETQLTDLEIHQGRVVGAVVNDRDTIPCDSLLLAPGHSARDTYAMLERHGVNLEAKSFAIGVRVEHPAALINQIQYGAQADKLPAADYVLRYNEPESKRGVYSFCMCPGGEVVNAASEPGGLVVNGMSGSKRASAYSNSALVVAVRPQDWGGSCMGGIEFQRRWEQQAFRLGGGAYRAPAQNLMTFLNGQPGAIRSSCRPGIVEADLRQALPDFVTSGLHQALPHFDRKMRGFVTNEAVLVGVETRTSAPVRISRNEEGESLSHVGLFPLGEGAGYAGGIMSAALDGFKGAESVYNKIVNRSIT
ncbi:MAG: hypothetical protein OET90_05555 [Desulfuromonadales bacterium]|nr:hypothetical protein [Desulfuromonadales bacterium]